MQLNFTYFTWHFLVVTICSHSTFLRIYYNINSYVKLHCAYSKCPLFFATYGIVEKMKLFMGSNQEISSGHYIPFSLFFISFWSNFIALYQAQLLLKNCTQSLSHLNPLGLFFCAHYEITKETHHDVTRACFLQKMRERYKQRIRYRWRMNQHYIVPCVHNKSRILSKDSKDCIFFT